MRGLKYEDILAQLKYGFSKRKGTIYYLRRNEFRDLGSPVFFLSTGRTGTKWFAELLRKDKRFLVFHTPTPDLSVQSVFAYNLIQQDNHTLSREEITALQEIFLAGREEQLRYSYKTQKRYIETNNYLTFFAPVLARLFPQSKFVHLYRHPGEFVRSAINRNYYGDNDNNIIRRIKPVEGYYRDIWDNLTQIEKSAWLWNETNLFLEDFKSKINTDRVFSFNFNELSIESVKSLAQFIGLDFEERLIRKKMKKKKNVQKTKKFPPYEQWSEDEKLRLKNICGDLAEKYGYMDII